MAFPMPGKTSESMSSPSRVNHRARTVAVKTAEDVNKELNASIGNLMKKGLMITISAYVAVV